MKNGSFRPHAFRNVTSTSTIEKRLDIELERHFFVVIFQLESMFIGNDACPIEYLPEMQFCAAQGMDHSQVRVSVLILVSKISISNCNWV